MNLERYSMSREGNIRFPKQEEKDFPLLALARAAQKNNEGLNQSLADLDRPMSVK